MSTQLLLRRLLEQPHRSGRQDFVLALETGAGAAATEEVPTPEGTFRVCRASSELALRHELWRSGANGLVAFVPDALAREMPADLLLSSRNQRVQVLTANEVIHNASFERRVLAAAGIALDGVFDTMQVSGRLRGADALGGHGLGAVCERELGAGLDKSAQTSNWGLRPLTVEQVRYAALDAEVLPAL